jgi:hypothetical protein
LKALKTICKKGERKTKTKIVMIMATFLISMILATAPRAFAQNHDVAVTDVVASPNAVYRGWNVTINVTVVNYGDGPEDFNVTVFYNVTANGKQLVSSLASNESRTLTFLWNTTGVAYGNYTVKAIADNVTGETNATNNEFPNGIVQVKILGDVNGDGIVEMMDFNAMTNAFGAYIGHARYDVQSDLNQDGKVDIRDFYIAGQNYLKHA